MRDEPFLYGTLKKQFELQQGIRSWLKDIPFNFFVTANFNCDTSEQSVRSALRRWHGQIDRKLLGPKWNKRPDEQRTLFVAFVEHPDNNRHFHMMVKSTAPIVFEAIAENAWQKIVPAGSMDVQYLVHRLDRMKTTNYSTKDVWNPYQMSNFIISTEFSAHT